MRSLYGQHAVMLDVNFEGYFLKFHFFSALFRAHCVFPPFTSEGYLIHQGTSMQANSEGERGEERFYAITLLPF